MYRLIISIALLTLISSCDNPNRAILGKWMMHQVIQDGVDVTEEHNPENERYFLMNEDNTFISDGKPYGKNTGKYNFDHIEKILFIDGDQGEEDDSRWAVTIQNKTMIWQGVGTEWAKGFKIIYIRPHK